MNKYFINDKVDYWKDGERFIGTIYSAKRTITGKTKYTIATSVFAGFDPEGIGREKYRYYIISEDCILKKYETEGENRT